MTTRPRGSDPRHIKVSIQGRPGHWVSSAPGGGGPATAINTGTKPPAKIDGRRPDGRPNAQAFSLPFIQVYPTRTGTCRSCPELDLHACSRGCCSQLSLGHSFLLNAIADGNCPLGKFTEEL